MEKGKRRPDPSDYRESQSFKQSYAGTFVERMYQQKNSEHSNQPENYSEGQVYPMEMKLFLDKCGTWLGKHHNAVTAVFTALIFFATCVYAVFALLQWNAMRGQLLAMQDAMKLERPWIGPIGRKKILQNTVDSKGKPISELTGVEWYFQNGGRTAATKTRIHIVIKLGPPTPTTVFTSRDDLPKNELCEKGELDSSFGDFPVIPGVPHTSFNARFSAPPGEYGSIDAALASGHNLWLVGCVDYSDSSLKPWFRTNVLEYWNPQDQSFALWQTGNDAH
jgi:hypothetical protein